MAKDLVWTEADRERYEAAAAVRAQIGQQWDQAQQRADATGDPVDQYTADHWHVADRAASYHVLDCRPQPTEYGE